MIGEKGAPIPILEKWLPRKDSNLDKEIQNLSCYRYTTRQMGGAPQDLKPEAARRKFAQAGETHGRRFLNMELSRADQFFT